MFHCDKCDADCIEAYAHRCDKWNVACMGKHVCIDCNLRHFSSLKGVRAFSLREVRSISRGGILQASDTRVLGKEGLYEDGCCSEDY